MKRKFTIGFLSIVVLAITVLTLLPQTGWLVRAQLRTATGITLPLPQGVTTVSDTARFAQVLQAHPNDYLLQLGGALHGFSQREIQQILSEPLPPSHEQVQRLSQLEARFPDKPSLFAHQLRLLTMGSVRLKRHAEQFILEAPHTEKEMESWRSSWLKDTAQSRPEDVERFIQLAERGTVLDPDNAFFPTMQAVGFFCQNRDELARETLQRAAEKPFWNDYAMEEASSHIHLIKTATGEMGSLGRMAITASVLLPHYASVRATARLATAQAITFEVEGKTAEGMAIRKAVARIGATIRTSSTVTIGRLVGIAVTAIAAARPGGAPALGTGEIPDGDERSQKNVERYVAYLNGVGETQEAQWYRAEIENAVATRAVIRKSVDGFLTTLFPLDKAITHWMLGIVLLWNVSWTAILGFVAFLLARNPRIREGKPLHPAVGWGLAYPLLAGIGTVALQSVLLGKWSWENADISFHIAICLITLLIPLLALKRGVQGKAYWQNLGYFVATVVALLTVFLAVPLMLTGFGKSFSEQMMLTQSFGSYFESDTSPSRNITPYWFLLALCGVLPLLLLVALPIVSWVRRIPVSVGVVRGVKQLAIPLIILFLSGYVVTTIVTARVEADNIRRVNAIQEDEAAFGAKLLGLTLPGRTPEP